MGIWVDADACPGAVKEILFRAADRTGTKLTLVANQRMRVPNSENIDFLLVGSGFDVADELIVEKVSEGDLVVTSDIPLASDVIKKGALVLTPRGEQLSDSNISSRLAVRDILANMRASGEETSGPPPMKPKHKQDFANHLDKYLTRNAKNSRET